MHLVMILGAAFKGYNFPDCRTKELNGNESTNTSLITKLYRQTWIFQGLDQASNDPVARFTLNIGFEMYKQATPTTPLVLL